MLERSQRDHLAQIRQGRHGGGGCISATVLCDPEPSTLEPSALKTNPHLVNGDVAQRSDLLLGLRVNPPVLRVCFPGRACWGARGFGVCWLSFGVEGLGVGIDAIRDPCSWRGFRGY